MNPPRRFQDYETVRVTRAPDDAPELAGLTGTVLGFSERPENGEWHCGVFIDAQGLLWDLPESALESTGHVGQRADHYDDSRHLRVRVDAQGRGTLVDDEDDDCRGGDKGPAGAAQR
jgi:Immunity protein 31